MAEQGPATAPGEFYPWLKAAYLPLCDQLTAGSLHHGLLLSGPTGLGKGQLARHLAQRLLCTAATGARACGHCKNCQLVSAGHHPDLHLVAREADKQQIGIDAIRRVQKKLSDKGMTHERRVVLIDNVESLTESAANALLKTLEEPAAGVYFLLTCDALNLLPATVVSRCRLVKLARPAVAPTLAWLQRQTGEALTEAQLALFDYSPLRAARELADGQLARANEVAALLCRLLAGEPVWVELEAQIADHELAAIGWMQLVLVDLCRRQQAPSATGPFAEQPALSRLDDADPQQLQRLYRRLSQLSRELHDNPGLNKTLQLQRVLTQA